MFQFPQEFDAEYYKNIHPDLTNMSDIELINHYNIYGINEGRVCSSAQCRDYYYSINKKFTNNCLEIGPFDVPILKGGLIDPRMGTKYNSIGSKKEIYLFDFSFEEIQNLFKYWMDK